MQSMIEAQSVYSQQRENRKVLVISQFSVGKIAFHVLVL